MLAETASMRPCPVCERVTQQLPEADRVWFCLECGRAIA